MSASPTFRRRFLALWMPFLPTDRIKRRDPTRLEPDAPLVLVSKSAGAQRIMAADATAQRHCLHVGMALAQARAMQPQLCVYPHEAIEDERLLERIADWSDRYTPLVGRDSPYGLILDITGCAHLLGGEHALLSDLIERLARQGLYATAAIAPTVGAAWALSRCTAPRRGDGRGGAGPWACLRSGGGGCPCRAGRGRDPAARLTSSR